MCHLLWWIGQGGNFYSLFGPKNTNLVEDVKILLLSSFAEFCSAVSEEKSKYVSANQRPGRPYCFLDQPQKHKLGRGRWELAFCQVSLNSVQRFQRRSRKCLSQSETRRLSCFSDQPEKHKLGKGRLDLASCQVSLNSVQRFYREVKHVSANQRPGRPSCFSDLPEKRKPGRGCWDLANPVKFCWIIFSGFRGKVENVSANHRPGRPFCFSDPSEKHKLGRGALRSCYLSSFVEFLSVVSEEKSKMS